MVVARLAAAAWLTACTASVSKREMPDASAPDESVVETASSGIERFIGRLSTSPTVRFGGSPYCTYSMTLKNIVVDATMHPEDGLVTMVVADTTGEAIVGSCPYPAASSSRQYFDHGGAPVLPDAQRAYTPMLAGAPANSPRADAIATLTNDKTQLRATVQWHRTDQGPPLDWTVKTVTPIVLDRVTCEVGDVYCLGGATQGGEYGCVDGFHFELLKRCTNGCAPTTQLPPAPHDNEQCR